ncbi:MAG: ATP-binding protein [Peptostreptococcaceae bacterium]
MKSTLNITDDYLIILDKNYKIIFCNDKILEKLGYKSREIKDKSVDIIIKNNDLFDKKRKDINLKLLSKYNEYLELDSEFVYQDETIVIMAKEKIKKTYTVKELEQMLDNLPFDCWLKNTNGEYIFINESYTKELNDKRGNILGKTSKDYWSEEEAKLFMEMDREVIDTKKYQVTEHYSQNGEYEIWTETYKAPILNKDDEVKYLIGYTKDITLQKKIDNEVQRNNDKINDINGILTNYNEKKSMEESLQSIGDKIIKYLECDSLNFILENKINGSVDLNIESGVKDKYNINDFEFENYYESLESIHNSNSIDIILNIKEIKSDKLKKYMKLNKIENIGLYSIVVDDNTVGFLLLKFYEGSNLKYNKFDYIKNLCKNIGHLIKNYLLSNELKSEFEIRKRIERQLELYLEISVDLVARLDMKGNIQYLNNNWTETLGWSIHELKFMSILDIIDTDSINIYNDVINNDMRNLGHGITKVICKDGTYKWIEMNYSINKDENNIILTAKDITEQKKRDEEKRLLEEAIQMESLKNEFFANISHEFRTPLNIILGTMQLIQRHIDRNKISWDNSLNFESNIHYIKQNSYRLLRLVNNLIDMTCIDSGYFEVKLGNHNIVNIVESITLSVVEYIEEKGINLVFDTNMEEVIIACDPDKIERIMLNLLSNAIKYTEKEGMIEVNINATDTHVNVSVKDNGIGMSKDKLNVIFDRFKRVDNTLNRKCEGSGIGLSLVKSLVELQNGKIYVDSELDIGSEFIFEIPITYAFEGKDNTLDNEVVNKAQIEKCNIEFSDIYS